MVKKDSGSTVSKKESKKEDTNKKTKKKTSASSKKQQVKEDSKVEAKEVELEADSVPVEDQELSSDTGSSLEDRKKQAAKNFSVTVSFSLYSKLLSQAEEEGISLDEYAGELLSEGCVVRAWDIQSLNYNSSFKGVNAGGGYRPNPNMGNGSNNFRMNKKSKKGMSHARYQNIMNDKSAFMEYVRRSDKEKRR